MIFQVAAHMRIIGWLTFVICLGATGDLVHDLAFEEPNVATDDEATAGDPDNAAEHLLMPSQRVVHSTTDIVAATPPTDLDAISTALTLTNHTVLKAAFSKYKPPSITPFFFSVPLRI